MSAYGHQMEREYSAQSLSSRGGSDRESHYVVETGFYMTSFAATIFIAALVTIGVLFITLLIALTVMLQSCQSRSAGLIESQKSDYDYNKCKIFVMHAELNNLESGHIPIVCRVPTVLYIKQGQYARDLNSTMSVVENFFSNVSPLNDGLDVVLMDVDDILSSNPHNANILLKRYDEFGCSNCIEEVKHLKEMLIHNIYKKLHDRSWTLVLFSRRAERQKNATIEHLVSSGYRDWSSLIMRSEDEMHMDSCEYLSRRKAALLKEGFRLRGTISSRLDALTGSYSREHIFKVPNPLYYNFEDQKENADKTS
ncbi:hypothetical protein FEM48_Zijuj03G0100400 [Ziziphus jujuba var. spinosa]|uniref:Uncharacterized protein n=1 Tax=Ziziphus jujuba var. spinosa TaxID=714518 RepID=A0A978VPN3_ZIZJJ|nr:hypothetical protein FEM48_Zijuj03G0100400 [Ziziphus jujuba var. spinosa]